MESVSALSLGEVGGCLGR